MYNDTEYNHESQVIVVTRSEPLGAVAELQQEVRIACPYLVFLIGQQVCIVIQRENDI
jgi:hypothetical protein